MVLGIEPTGVRALTARGVSAGTGVLTGGGATGAHEKKRSEAARRGTAIFIMAILHAAKKRPPLARGPWGSTEGNYGSVRRMTTRRLRSLPSAVELSAIGSRALRPSTVMREASMPWRLTR